MSGRVAQAAGQGQAVPKDEGCEEGALVPSTTGN